MWAGGAPTLPRADSDVGGSGRLPALELGSLRLQLEGGQRLGGRVAWDRASGLLAAELQAEEGASTIAVAILDPQAPEVRSCVLGLQVGGRRRVCKSAAAVLCVLCCAVVQCRPVNILHSAH